MWLFYVILALCVLAALVITILLCRIHVILIYDKEFCVKIKILGISFDVYPERKKKKFKMFKAQKKSSESTRKKSFLKRAFKFTESFCKVLKVLSKTAKKIVSRITLNNLEVLVKAGGKNSADAAVKYGQVSAILYPAAQAIVSLMPPKECKVCVQPDFFSQKTCCNLNINLSARTFDILFMIMVFAKKYSELT